MPRLKTVYEYEMPVCLSMKKKIATEPVVFIRRCDNNATLCEQMRKVFFFLCLLSFLNIFCTVVLFCRIVMTVPACNRSTPFSACFAYKTFLRECKGTCECVCNACMTVWNASADASVFLHFYATRVELARLYAMNVQPYKLGCVRQCVL